MNKLSTILLTALAATAARADDGWLKFCTEGPDTYADGTAVLPGESYALVWTANDAFGGLAADGTPAVAGDRVIVTAPVAARGAKGMHCPEVLFQVTRATLDALGEAGSFSVVLLDTRIETDGALALAPRRGGRPTLVNGWGATSGTVASIGAGALAEAAGDGKRAAAMAAVPAGVEQPTIKSLVVDGDNVVLTVESRGGYVRAQGGADISADETTGPAKRAEAGGDITIVMPKPDAARGFFRVVGN